MPDQADNRDLLPAALDELTALGLGPDRRNFIIGAVLAVGAAGVPLPAFAKVTRRRRKPARFLTPARFAVLDAVAETIMPRTDTPGARDALVPQRFDALMQSWASPQTQTDFTRIIDEIDLSARPRNARGIVALAAPQQLEIVAAYDKLKMADRSYGRFKNLIFALYYLSEAGATQELRYEHTPGAWEPSIAVSSDTRGYALDISFGGN